MKVKLQSILAVCFAVLIAGCGTYNRAGLPPEQARALESKPGAAKFKPSHALATRIMALDPEHVTEAQILETLAQAPAPRVFNIHGGIGTAVPSMISFGQFLIGMGYPAISVTNPSDGTYTFSCYESADMIAGIIAWYYERDGLRPMIVGHSQGGMQAIKILYRFAGDSDDKLAVWNPLTWQEEGRYEITDPLTGRLRPVVGLQLSYVSAVGSGGPTRVFPNQWEMTGRLRDIPDSVVDFTGFCKAMDLLGGEFLGYGPANEYHSIGTAHVRNVWLPTSYSHHSIPDAVHLSESQELRDWVNAYQPSDIPIDDDALHARFGDDANNILYAADVWYSIKKHWVLELQRLIQARHTTP